MTIAQTLEMSEGPCDGRMLKVANYAGCCFLLGGAKHKHQTFNTMLNKACCSLLLLACIGLVIPTAAKRFFPADGQDPGNDIVPAANPQMTEHAVANMSHATALILGFV